VNRPPIDSACFVDLGFNNGEGRLLALPDEGPRSGQREDRIDLERLTGGD
jgi:hypothetical protein